MVRKALIVLLITAIVAVAGAAAVWQIKGSAIMAGARDTLERELTTALGNSVSVGQIDIGINSIGVRNIELYDKQGSLAADVSRLTVFINPLTLISGKSPLDAIYDVTVVSPRLYLRQRPDKSWNLEDFRQKKQSDSPSFSGTVHISDGIATLNTLEQGEFSVQEIHGMLDFSAYPGILVALTARHNGALVRAEGAVNGKPRDALTVSADRLRLTDYLNVLPKDIPVRLSDGYATNIRLTVLNEADRLRYLGELQLEGAAATVAGTPVASASGLISFDEKSVHIFNAKARIWEQAVTGSGRIMLDMPEPLLDVTVAAPSLDLAVLPVTLPVHGSAGFQVRITGTPSDLSAAGEVRMANGQLERYLFSDAFARFRYAGSQLDIEESRASLCGGQITASGNVDLAGQHSDLRVAGRKIETRQLAAAHSLDKTGGLADFDMVISGGLDIARLNAFGTLTIGPGEVSGIPVASLYSGFHLDQGRLTLEYLNAGIDQGVLNAAGQWDILNDSLQLNVFGYKLPLERTAVIMPEAKLAGMVDFRGRITGTTSNPEAAVKFTASYGQVLEQPFEAITGELGITKETASLNNIQVVNGATQHKIEGTINLAGRRDIHLTLATRQARMETLLKIAPTTERITGNVDHETVLTGTLDDITAEGRLSLKDGSCRGYLLDSVTGTYRYHHGTLAVNDLVVNSLGNQLIVSGTANLQKEFSFSVVAHDIDLARLPLDYPYPVTGRAHFTGRVYGTADVPQLSGQLTVPTLTANGQALGQINAALNVTGMQVDCPEATFTQDQSVYRLSAGINLADGTTYGSLTVGKGQVSTIANLLKQKDKIILGELNGQFTWHGTLNKPHAAFSGSITGASVKGYSLGDVEMAATLDNRIVTLENFMVKQGAGVLVARGKADLEGELNMEAGARDIDATFFSKLFDTTVETKGNLSFTAQLTGKTASPHTALSLEIANGSVANASFDSLYGLLIFDKGSIHVNQILLSKGEYKASAYGVIPLAALNTEGRKKATAADQMDLTFRLDNANLSILPLMTKAVKQASGETKGEVKVTGTLAQPFLSGKITATDGMIRFADLEDPIQKVTVDIQFQGDKIQVNRFEGNLGGGSYRLTGAMVLRDMALHDYNMDLTLDQMVLKHKYFKGPVNGILKLTEQKNMPHLAGKIVLANTTVNIPPIAPGASQAFPFDAGLDVELIVGDKVRLYNPVLYDVWVEGRVRFAGSLHEPDVSGRIEATRGMLNYLRTVFKISEASVAFTQFRSFEPVLSLTASTRLEQTTINLAVNGPVSAMEVHLTSEPQMSQQEVISLLTLRSKYFDRQSGEKRDTGIGRDELVGMLDAGLQLQFFAEIESMFRNSLGLDEFRLVRGTAAADPDAKANQAADREIYKIEVGKYITDRLMLSYTTGVNSGEHSYGARYDLTKRISLTADVDEFNRKRIGVGMRFNF